MDKDPIKGSKRIKATLYRSTHLKESDRLGVAYDLWVLDLTCLIASSFRRRALPRLGEFAIRSQAGLSEHTPVMMIVSRWYGRVGLGHDEQALPVQTMAQIRVIDVKAFSFAFHAAPPRAACITARFTATRAS